MIDIFRSALCITGADHLEIGPSLSAVAGHLVHEVGELRAQGQFPERAAVCVDVAPDHRELDVRIEGLSPECDPDLKETMAAIRCVFELASHANVVDVTGAVAPLFTVRILAVDQEGVPYSGLIGAGMGDIHATVTHHTLW
ncbi:hypothetical protein QRX50_00065 [Amycolatopsis carbonis]|uniref:Uncharacterized protein n=1 Tax=Amycolatopsis carbonis TaxID=715471 RepID=A0A9Y2IF62_9PSEU|nr:hypothetical protein [Amycolatopsis sp. 2-15]WIX79250.1 hypothetical protein QRX50_00065 [Amycolatopsis sp. 2-15]